METDAGKNPPETPTPFEIALETFKSLEPEQVDDYRMNWDSKIAIRGIKAQELWFKRRGELEEELKQSMPESDYVRIASNIEALDNEYQKYSNELKIKRDSVNDAYKLIKNDQEIQNLKKNIRSTMDLIDEKQERLSTEADKIGSYIQAELNNSKITEEIRILRDRLEGMQKRLDELKTINNYNDLE